MSLPTHPLHATPATRPVTHLDRRRFASLLLQGALATTLPALAQSAPAAAGPRFSCMLWTLEDHATFDRCLEIVAAAGYNGVELVGEFHKWSPEETRRVLTRLQALNLVVDASSGVNAGFATPDSDGQFVSQIQAQLASMRQLNCRRMILLSGPVLPSLTPEQQRQTALTNLAKAADLAAPDQVEILIEPIDILEQPTIYLRGATQAFDLVQILNRPQVKVLYDLFHEQRSNGNLLEKLEAHLDLVGLLHIADVPGRHEPGTGEIDYPVIYRRLAQRGYNGWIAMEFYPGGDPVVTLRNARQQAQRAF